MVKALNAECNVYQESQQGKLRYEIITLRDAYERTNPFKDELFHHTNMTYIYLLSGVALLLFLVGVLNFVNIYMVLMMTRSLRDFIQLSAVIPNKILLHCFAHSDVDLVVIALYVVNCNGLVMTAKLF